MTRSKNQWVAMKVRWLERGAARQDQGARGSDAAVFLAGNKNPPKRVKGAWTAKKTDVRQVGACQVQGKGGK